MPRSRFKLAIPFVGKDVPSRASEFAHPDVIIGLTVLAYRCERLAPPLPRRVRRGPCRPPSCDLAAISQVRGAAQAGLRAGRDRAAARRLRARGGPGARRGHPSPELPPSLHPQPLPGGPVPDAQVGAAVRVVGDAVGRRHQGAARRHQGGRRGRGGGGGGRGGAAAAAGGREGGGAAVAAQAVQRRADGQALRAAAPLARHHPLVPRAGHLPVLHVAPAAQAVGVGARAGRRDALQPPPRLLGHALRPAADRPGQVRLRARLRRQDADGADRRARGGRAADAGRLERALAAAPRGHRDASFPRAHRHGRAHHGPEQQAGGQVPALQQAAEQLVRGRRLPRRQRREDDPRQGDGARAQALAVRHRRREALRLLRPGSPLPSAPHPSHHRTRASPLRIPPFRPSPPPSVTRSTPPAWTSSTRSRPRPR